jgi:Ca-activated chloride channel homolog
MTIASLDPKPKALPLRTRGIRPWLGLAAACLLAGQLTFLAGPARAVTDWAVTDWAEALGQPLSPDAAGTGAGQLLVQAGESGPLYPVPTLDTDVQIQVSGLVARVRVSQSFRNPSADWLNGIYVFPLPEDSAVDHLRLTIGERVIEGATA